MHRLLFPDLLNARDLGGHVTLDGRVTRRGSLVRSDSLVRLTGLGATALQEYGVRTVIDLRWPEEAAAQPSIFQLARGDVEYVAISLLGESHDRWRRQDRPTRKEAVNCFILEYAQRELARVMTTIAQAGEGAVLFHCESGKDRTGLVAMLLLDLAGVRREEIVQDYTLTIEYLREPYLAASPAEEREAVLERVRCPPEAVTNTLQYLETAYGGTAGYLCHGGLDERQINRLRQRLLDDLS